MTKLQPWQTLASTRVLDTPYAKVRRDACRLPSGLEIDDYYYWEGGDFAQVFALTQENEVVLVRQYKHGVKEIVLELPAGMIDEEDDTPLAGAQRELREETGYEAESWEPLGVFNLSSAKSAIRSYPYLARNARYVTAPHLDPTEEIEVVTLPIAEVLRLVSTGEIRDTSSVATCLVALQALGRV